MSKARILLLAGIRLWPGIMLGAFCLFFFLFVLFAKHLPSVSMTEMKETVAEGAGHAA